MIPQHTDSFVFGKGYIKKAKIFSWSPDAPQTQNGHVLIIGGSGSGKTRLLKKIIEYLNNRRKQIYIIDFHGDMETKNETVFVFSLRNSQYGLNPFEMEMDSRNGGPNAQASIILSNLKKNFIPNLGAIQKNVLRRFLQDCYRYVGILDEREETWNKKLPTIETMMELFHRITEKVNLGQGSKISELLTKIKKQQLQKLLEQDEEKCSKIEKRIAKTLDELNLLLSKFTDHVLEGKYKDIFGEIISPYIDIDFYLDHVKAKTFLKLSPYFSELSASSVFTDNKPPKTRGVVRYDISGFTNTDKPSEAMFFADTVIQKIFRAVKMRGEYRNSGKKGKVDTYVVIDESKLILPVGKEKENPYNILNRIVTESRKYGMGLIVVSQRPTHFPEEMLSSIYTKIILRINENDIKGATKSLGVKDQNLFSHLNSPGVALIGNTGGLFDSIVLEKQKKPVLSI